MWHIATLGINPKVLLYAGDDMAILLLTVEDRDAVRHGGDLGVSLNQLLIHTSSCSKERMSV